MFHRGRCLRETSDFSATSSSGFILIVTFITYEFSRTSLKGPAVVTSEDYFPVKLRGSNFWTLKVRSARAPAPRDTLGDATAGQSVGSTPFTRGFTCLRQPVGGAIQPQEAVFRTDAAT